MISFSIEFDNSFTVDYFPDNKYYLRLRKIDSTNGVVLKELSVGENININSDEKALKWLKEFNTKLSKQIDNYNFISIEKDQINNEEKYLLKSITNFDQFNSPLFLGNYISHTFFEYPPSSSINGISVSYLTHHNLIDSTKNIDEEFLKIWSTFKYYKE